MTKPRQSAETVAHCDVVLYRYPNAQARLSDDKSCIRIINVNENNDTASRLLGFATTSAAAWADASRNVTRPPSTAIERKGHSTWSLASDEKYWRAHIHLEE